MGKRRRAIVGRKTFRTNRDLWLRGQKNGFRRPRRSLPSLPPAVPLSQPTLFAHEVVIGVKPRTLTRSRKGDIAEENDLARRHDLEPWERRPPQHPPGWQDGEDDVWEVSALAGLREGPDGLEVQVVWQATGRVSKWMTEMQLGGPESLYSLYNFAGVIKDDGFRYFLFAPKLSEQLRQLDLGANK